MLSKGLNMEKIRKLLEKVVRIEKRFCVISLVIMLAINFAQVILRYVFNSPFAWSEEVILILLVWFGFICMSIDIEMDDHMALFGLYNMFSDFGKKVLDILRHVFLSVFFFFMTIYGYQLFRLALRKKLPASHLSQGLQFAPILVGGFIMCVFSLANLFDSILNKNRGIK